MLASQPQRRLGDLVDVQPGVVGPPVDPRGRVVLAVGVVVAALGAAALVTGGQHRHPAGEAQGRHQVGGLAPAQRDDLGIVGLALDAAVPRPVVVGAVTVVLAVGLVVLAVVGHQVAQREAVVCGDEVDRRVRRAAVVGVQVARAGEPGRHRAYAGGSPAPEVAQGVAELVVPLDPRRRELSHPVAVHRRVPRLGDQLDVTQGRVLADGGDQVAAHVDDLVGAGQGAHQVEAEAVDVHLGDPVAQRVEDHPQALGVRGVDGVAAARHVPIGVLHRRGREPGGGLRHHALVVAEVVETAEAQCRAERPGLGGVVVDHVEDDLEPGLVEGLDHLLELGDLLAPVATG